MTGLSRFLGRSNRARFRRDGKTPGRSGHGLPAGVAGDIEDIACHDYPPDGRETLRETTVAEQRAANIHVRDGIISQRIRRHAHGTRRDAGSTGAHHPFNSTEHPRGRFSAGRI
jgi:hypothetical protein